ncbi:MAG: hypothetical protein AAGA18_07750 [Verrucomicrobiota bacterium]
MDTGLLTRFDFNINKNRGIEGNITNFAGAFMQGTGLLAKFDLQFTGAVGVSGIIGTVECED